MLSAKQAREKTDENKVANFRKEIEKIIMHAIDKGRDAVNVSGTVPAEIIDELKENGYTVEKQAVGVKISW